MNSIAPYLKAIVAFVAPGVVGLAAAVQDGSDNGSSITGPEWVGIIAACVLTAAGVYATPNRDPKALHQQESVQPPEPRRNDLGYGAIELLVAAVIVVVLVILLLRLV